MARVFIDSFITDKSILLHGKIGVNHVDGNSEEGNDNHFQPGGLFDLNNGSQQTRLFAEAFHRHVKVPLAADFSLLDAGCALGDALPVWRKYYPHARLHGCDFSAVAIRRCQEVYGDVASFFRASFKDISAYYDVIYCSNVLEHFSDYLRIAEILLHHCSILYVLVPYMELRNGKPLSPESGYYHKTTFHPSSFDALNLSGDRIISMRVIRVSGAWSPTALGELRWFVRRHLLRRPGGPPRQALFEIKWVQRG